MEREKHAAAGSSQRAQCIRFPLPGVHAEYAQWNALTNKNAPDDTSCGLNNLFFQLAAKGFDHSGMKGYCIVVYRRPLAENKKFNGLWW